MYIMYNDVDEYIYVLCDFYSLVVQNVSVCHHTLNKETQKFDTKGKVP